MAFSVPGFVIVILVIWYSIGVWKSTDKYFKEEYNKHLQKEIRKNKYLKEEEIKKLLKKETTLSQASEEINDNTNMKHDTAESFLKKDKSMEPVTVSNERQQKNEEDGWIEDNSPPCTETHPLHSMKIKSINKKQNRERIYEEEFCSIKGNGEDCND